MPSQVAVDVAVAPLERCRTYVNVGGVGHGVRVAWGGGCPKEVWRPFEERFGVVIRECYGMTECSSFTTANLDGPVGSVGKPLPWFDVILADAAGLPVAPGERGEMEVRERLPGALT